MTDEIRDTTTTERVATRLESDAAIIEAGVEAARGEYLAVPKTDKESEIYEYDGKRWVPDRAQGIRKFVRTTVIPEYQRQLLAESLSDEYDDDDKAAMRASVKSLESEPRFKRIVDGIRLDLLDGDTILDPAGAVDPKNRRGVWLFNVENGTYDLMTDELRPHDPADMLTQVAPVFYDPDATCPAFDAFLDEILPDRAIQDFVLELFAYGMNATMEESVLPILVGKGANGKSTLTEVIAGVFGREYTGDSEGNIFAATKNANPEGPSPVRMSFKNKRIMFARETPEDMTLNAQMVKEFTSFEPVSGRYLNKGLETFSPTHIAFLVTNHMPDIVGNDDGIWRRVLEIPFKVKIPVERQRKGYHIDLLRESSGILNRLIAAHRRWLDRGHRFDVPQAVRDATAMYREESNPLATFIVDTYDFTDKNARTSSDRLYSRYEAWADRSNIRVIGKTRFIANLRREYDLGKYNAKGVRGLVGVKIKDDRPSPDDGPAPDDPIEPPDDPGGREIFVDVETTGLNPAVDRVRLVQIGFRGLGQHVYDVWNDDERERALTVLNNNRKKTFVAHNAAFDLAFLEGSLGYVHPGPVFDTMTAAQIANAGRPMPKPAPKYIEYYYKNGNPKYKSDTPFSLRSVAFRETDVLLNKDLQRSDWSAPELTAEQIEYAKADVDVLPSVVDALRPQLDGIGTVGLDMENVKVAARMLVQGVQFDVEAWRALGDERMSELQAVDAKLDELNGEAANWNAPANRRAIVEKFGNSIPDATIDTIKAHAATNEAAALLTERAEHFKYATTYADKFIDKNVDELERIRTGYKVAATVTGRFSSSPNLQNIPRDKRYRACFKPSPGNKFVIADWSQIEVRLIAAASGDKALQAALEGDVYVETARSVLGVDDVTSEDRQKAKAIVLGFQYGMGVKSFQDYARNTFDVHLTEDEARAYQRRFKAAYPRLARWQRDTGDPFDYDVPDADKTTTVNTYLGRKRFDVRHYTERINTPIQATGADALKLALVELHRRGYVPALHVHDEIVLDVPEDQADVAARELEDVMRAAALAAQDPDTAVEIPTEANVGDSWADKA